MRLIDNWKAALTRGWSAWCIYAASIMAVGQYTQMLVGFVDLLPLILVTLLLGVVLRVVKQRKVSGA